MKEQLKSLGLLQLYKLSECPDRKGGIQIRSMYVDLPQRSVDKRTNTEPSNGAELEETNVVHYAMHKVGMSWHFR